MMKRIIFLVFSVFITWVLLLTTTNSTYAQVEETTWEQPNEIELIQVDNSKSTIYLYWKASCPHCKDAKQFLSKLDNENIEVKYFDVTDDKEAKKEFLAIAKLAWIPKTVPLFFINWEIFQGFVDKDTTWKKLITAAEKYVDINPEDILTPQSVISWEKELPEINWDNLWICDAKDPEACQVEWDSVIDVPIFGTIDLASTWLSVWSIILWFVDWFNPCAMWVLLIFLTALIEFGDKKKMFQVAWIFILAEAIMYYMILNVWMFSRDFIWLDMYITPIVWLLATWAWLYFLYEWKTWTGACKVWSLEKKRKTHEKIKDIASRPMTWVVFFAILALALSVNIIEFACSIWIPQTFTKILDLNVPSMWAKQYYNFLYILFYMLDDVFVFAIAIYSFDKIWVTTKYTKMSHLIGWILMLLLWLIMLIDPSLLVW